MSAEERDAAMERLSFTTDVNDLKDCDLIIEAIGGGEDGAIENKPLKLQVWKEMDQVVKPEAVFASNTSMFTIADLAEVTTRKDRFIGMHLFSPANIMKLVEVTHTEDTSEEVTNLIVELSKSMGKVPIILKDVPGDTGFVGNRILFARQKQALSMVYDGLMPWDIDKAINEFGFKMGPFQMSDLAGLDIGWKKGEKTTNPIRDALCELDRRGQKTNAGYYDYDENRVPRISKLTEELIKNITGKEKEENMNSAEIIEHCICLLYTSPSPRDRG